MNLSSKDIKAVRKAHRCEQCNTDIAIGEPANYQFGIWEGEPFGVYTHFECRTAANEYAELNDLWFEDYPWFQFMDNSEHDHHAWLLENHPIVAARLNIIPKAETSLEATPASGAVTAQSGAGASKVICPAFTDGAGGAA